MAWFKRKEQGIQTPTSEKKDSPDGLWYKTNQGKIIHMQELRENAYVCPDDEFHVRIGSKEYFEIIFDDNTFTELDENMTSGNPLSFKDSKTYEDRIAASQKKTELKDACRTVVGKVNGLDLVVSCMDFSFIGGSMGSVVGEKIARGIDHALANKIPFMMISKSGGARMMEAGFSLMQMAKTSAKLALLDEAGLPYISLLTDPTTGGVTASYAMLGDINIAEPGALIGFAGPRVIRETIGKDLPKGFQSAEFLQEHGFVDMIVNRRELKRKLTTFLKMIQN
ncbi:acetyl-CoA carboxylase, carboxyltransferase subunit beta [Flammeovirga sp. SJP92]|uniref:acetyl-CoA carboxylase, carboxyltransferase subunit beta n=1 Tax=Flammeovirga sp. SJP92 TaxID=1775430 RepID=UPI000786C441|nr:acetyl-CoA carboxylase, carboxyltransferase subunit beta [Flammeovirga sp. SJP92]KXX71911.1 acetyl-coenzyme A carboxylase carboxyl transferase subunit beta [Flammeovirga sp. SJP92]